MTKNSVYAHTTTKENYKKFSKITARHWKIYYYMLSMSKYDAARREDHRYIYKNNFNISKMCRDIGIKSTSTFYNALKRLSEKRLIIDREEYYLIYAPDYIEINLDVMINLINCSTYREQDIDLLRTYLILKKLYKITENSRTKIQDRSFTVRNIVTILGHNDTANTYYGNVRIYLALLSYWGLIEFTHHLQSDANFGKYVVYHLVSINENNLSDEFESDTAAEIKADIMSEEMIKKLTFEMPEMFQD